MASADQQSSTPQVKFENSPAESFVSVPGGEMYPSLFCTPIPTTMNPMETVMSPQSLVGDVASSISQPVSVSSTPAPESEKKPVKKRKSWGQVLPEPKTNLPPRKRAKTEDEKEQRRVERVLRNRRAAQSSRERKRQEVEALERRNKELEQLLLQQQKQNVMLMNELSRFRREAGVVTRGSSPLDSFQPSPLTLSQPLFGSQENPEAKSGMMDDFILMPSATDDTVNPARLSPELSPVADTEAPAPSTPVALANASTTTTTSNDVTQHPAAVLCDLQCPSAEMSACSMASPPRQQPALALYLHLQLLWTISSAMLSACQRPLTLIAGALKHNLVLHPPLNFEYHNLDGDAPVGVQDFDFSQFVSDDVSGAAQSATAAGISVAQELEPTFGLFDSENQISSETLNQQPHTGASSHGCDDGVIAVGV